MKGNNAVHILLVEDSHTDANLIMRVLSNSPREIRITRVDNYPDFKEKLRVGDVDLVLSDFRLPKFSGVAVIQFVKSYSASIPVIVVSGAVGDEMAVELMKLGAADFVLKSRLQRIVRSVEVALKEKELRQLKDRAEAELRLVASIISHDLRAPLNNLNSLNQLLLDDDADNQLLVQSAKSIKNLQEILDGLIYIIRFEKSTDEIATAVNLQKVIDEIKLGLAQEIKETEAFIHLKGKNEIITILPFIKSILTNLIANAIKYKKADVPPEINIHVEQGDELNIITVADNGMGMDLSGQGKQVFEPFEQIRKGSPGYGLGLYIIKKQVEFLKGRIFLESTPGEGSTFSIYLPVEQSKRSN